MSKGISVVVCTYNGEERLPTTIRHLAYQVVSGGIDWEILIINNASTDNTESVSKNEWSKYNRNIPFRVIDQPVTGLSAARQKGFDCAKYDYVIFVDDDNWLCERYVELSFLIMEQHPHIGVLGGIGEPVFESTPPDWFEKYSIYYAVGAQDEKSGDISDAKGYVYGAGMVVRKPFYQKLKEKGFQSYVEDRKKKSLSSSGDNEICYILRLAGYKIWYDERLEFKHYIPHKRLQWNYFLNLIEGAHRSGVYLAPYLDLLNNKEIRQQNLKRVWLFRTLNIIFQVFKLSKYSVRYILTGHYLPDKHRKYRRLIGELKGWLSIRTGYAQRYNNLNSLKSDISDQSVEYRKSYVNI